ncbi:MAG: phosphatidate cytidylyltransferase [Bacteroidetes bacterium]|nr:MAG: phosphatidate cytidylyltransferase [Bacteroidota bacterium]
MLTSLALILLLPGCDVIGDIFRAGVWTGVIVIVLVIALIIFLIVRLIRWLK